MQCSLSDSSWCQASLPVHFGGFPSASAALLDSCNNVRDLASTLLSVDVDQLEAAATLFLTFLYNNSFTLPTSQQDLQIILD